MSGAKVGAAVGAVAGASMGTIAGIGMMCMEEFTSGGDSGKEGPIAAAVIFAAVTSLMTGLGAAVGAVADTGVKSGLNLFSPNAGLNNSYAAPAFSYSPRF